MASIYIDTFLQKYLSALTIYIGNHITHHYSIVMSGGKCSHYLITNSNMTRNKDKHFHKCRSQT